MIIFSSFSPRFSTISLFTIVTGKVPIYPVERRTSDFLWYLRRSGSVDDVTTTRNVVGLPGILFPLDISGIRRYIQSFPSLFRPWHVSSSTFRKLEFRPVPSSSSASTSVSFFSCFAWFHIVAEVRPIANRWIGTFALIISPGRDALGNGEPRKPRGAIGSRLTVGFGTLAVASNRYSVYRVYIGKFDEKCRNVEFLRLWNSMIWRKENHTGNFTRLLQEETFCLQDPSSWSKFFSVFEKRMNLKKCL